MNDNQTSHQKKISRKFGRAKIEAFLDPELAKIDGTFWPDQADFERQWGLLTANQKLVVGCAVSARTMGELIDETNHTPRWVMNQIREVPAVIRAIITARMCQLPSDTARTMYLETVIANKRARNIYYDEIVKLIKSDKQHLQELAGLLDITGDGKRAVLKEIIAYGMQVKKVEDEERDDETGQVTSPAVMALADPRMAFNGIQELNKMDHEYGQDDKATSSVEGQAQRIKRLKAQMNKNVKREAKTVNAVARLVATRELKDFTKADLGD